jgi:hypothetical protein
MRTRRQGGKTWFTRTFYSKEKQLVFAHDDLKRKINNIMEFNKNLEHRDIMDKYLEDGHLKHVFSKYQF